MLIRIAMQRFQRGPPCMFLATVALFLSASSHEAPGDGASIQRVTLSEALSYARTHQPSLQAARARVEAARHAAEIPRAKYLPRIGATAQVIEGTANNTTASYVNTPVLDLVRIGGTPANDTPSWSPAASSLVGLGLRQEIFDFGRVAAQAAAADFLRQAAEEQASLEIMNLDLLVQESYFGVQAAHSVLRASEAAYQRAKAHQELAAAGVNSGLRSPIELTRAEADLARSDVGRVRAQGSLNAAQSVLAAAMGSPQPAVDAAEDEVPYRAPPPMQQVLSQIQERDPAVREATSLRSAQAQRSNALAAELRPDLTFSAGINGRAGGALVPGKSDPTGQGFVPQVPNWDALVVLSWPLWEPTVSTEVAVSRAEENVRAAEVDVVRERVRADVLQAYQQNEVTRAALPALMRAFDAAKANYAQADARFKAGLGTSVELADAEALLTDSEIQLAIGRYEVSRSRAQLGRAISEAVP